MENALYAQPEVKEVAVVGVPDLRLGELVVAVVNLKRGTEGNITEGKLIALCKKLYVSGILASQYANTLSKSPSIRCTRYGYP